MVISAYIDVPTYLRAPTGQEAASLLGLNTTIGGGSSVPAGTLSLPVISSAGWSAGPLWLLDGPSSEVVQATGAADATHLTLGRRGRRWRMRRASRRTRRARAGRWPR